MPDSSMRVRPVEWPILAAVFLDLLGFGMVIADFQLRAESLVPAGWPVGAIIGFLLGSTFVIQILVSPRWGKLSDHRGRKPVVIACTLLSGSAMMVYGFAHALPLLLLSRVLAGLGSANVAVAQAFIADETEGEARTAALARVSAAVSAGLVLGPPLGGELASRGGSAAIGYSAGIASLLGALWLFLALPAVPPKEARAPGRQPAIDLTLLRDIPALRPMVLIAVVAWFSLATLEGTFARLIHKLFGYGQVEFGRLFGYESLLGILVSAYFVAWIVKRVRERELLRSAYFAQGLGLALNPVAASIAGSVHPMASLVTASTLYAAGAGIANPVINDICSKLTPTNRQGELFGLLQGSRAVGFVLGPMVGGILFDTSPAAPYFLAGAVCLLAAALVPRRVAQA